MNDDELVDQLRTTLRTQAGRITSGPDAWERFVSGNVTAARDRRRNRAIVPMAVIGIAAAVVIAFVALPRGHSRGVSVGAQPPQTVPESTTTTTSVPAVGPPGGPVPAGFEAMSVTFVSAQEGWVLGTAASSTAILRTRDGGHSWASIPAPPSTTLTTVRFADRLDGWAYGPGLWSTHDGGATWHTVAIPGAVQVSAVEASAGSAQAAVFTDSAQVRMATSPIGTDSWAVAGMSIPVGGGPVPRAEIVLSGRSGWVVEVDRTVVGAAQLAGGRWTAWLPPCLDVQGPALLAASSDTNVVAACDVGLWASYQGEHWYQRQSDGRFIDEGTVPVRHASAVATPVQGVVLVASDDGGIAATFDGGHTWSQVDPSPVEQLGFTTPTQGVAMTADHRLLMTVDGGHTWNQVTFSS